MKLFAGTALVLMLTGCSTITFDGLQFDRYVGVVEKTTLLQPLCSDKKSETALRAGLADLKQWTDHMDMYAQFRANTPEVKNSTAHIASMVTELSNRYKNNNIPSVAYCEEKLGNIKDGAKTITATLGAQ